MYVFCKEKQNLFSKRQGVCVYEGRCEGVEIMMGIQMQIFSSEICCHLQRTYIPFPLKRKSTIYVGHTHF